MTCVVVRDMLGAYLDGELDANSQFQIQLHLAGCEECTQLLERMRMRQQMIRRGGLSYQAPASLDARIRKSLRLERQRSSFERRPSFDWQRWGALAAALLLVSALSIRLWQGRTVEETRFAEAAVSSHVRALLSGHVADVASTDRHTVKPWFNGRLDFSPPVNDFVQQGFPLVGGRVDYINGRTVAALVYGRRKHMIDLFVWPSDAEDVTGTRSAKGYNVILWSAGGMSYAAASDLNAAELKQFKELVTR